MRTSTIIVVTVALSALAGIAAPRKVEALPGQQAVTEYFTDAARHHWCGTRTFTCSGELEMDGVTGPYTKKYKIPCEL